MSSLPTWEEELANLLWTTKGVETPILGDLYARLKSFIKQTIQHAKEEERKELRQKIEDKRRGPTLCGNCNLNGDLCTSCYANRQANKLLDEILSLLTPPSTE